MRCSVLITAYNSEQTIRQTLSSVLEQSRQPDEILVWDDGSTDSTPSILQEYSSVITVIRSQNGGVAQARNRLCERATGDLLAFIDHDDLWHPNYLKTQIALAERFSSAVAYYAGHANMSGLGNFDWNSVADSRESPQILSPLKFLSEYNRATGRFGSMSFCIFRRYVLTKIPFEPFHPKLCGAEDSFLASLFALLGDVVFNPDKLVCYRILESSLSANRLKMMRFWVEMFEILSPIYREKAERELIRVFKYAFGAKRRQYARLLMGAGQWNQARSQLLKSISCCLQLTSMLKSFALLTVSFIPLSLQPQWPSSQR